MDSVELKTGGTDTVALEYFQLLDVPAATSAGGVARIVGNVQLMSDTQELLQIVKGWTKTLAKVRKMSDDDWMDSKAENVIKNL